MGCELHAVGSTCFDLGCGTCRARCRGKGSCDTLLPLTHFTPQHRPPRPDKPRVLSAGLLKPLCTACTKRAKSIADAHSQSRADSVEERRRRLAIAFAVLEPAVRSFAEMQGAGAVHRYDADPLAKALDVRRADLSLKECGREQAKVPSSRMPAALAASPDPAEGALWMLRHCEWGDAAMPALVARVERDLLPLLSAKQAAMALPKAAVQALGNCMHRITDPQLAELLGAMCSHSFCAVPAELPSTMASGAWLDHRIQLRHDMRLPAPAGFTEDDMLAWIASLRPENLTSSWPEDGTIPLNQRPSCCHPSASSICSDGPCGLRGHRIPSRPTSHRRAQHCTRACRAGCSHTRRDVLASDRSTTSHPGTDARASRCSSTSERLPREAPPLHPGTERPASRPAWSPHIVHRSIALTPGAPAARRAPRSARA